MASAEVDSRPSERPMKRKPFANFVRRLGFKSNDQQVKPNSKKSNNIALKTKRQGTWAGNNPYPESGIAPQQQVDQQSFEQSERAAYSNSYTSLPTSLVNAHDRDGNSQSNKSGAPTLATNPETVHSDAGHSRAATTTTGAGALSSMEGAGAGSTFSSPNHSDHSLATTLTTIQSTSNAPTVANGISGGQAVHTLQSQPMGSQFSHQYPVSPSHSTMTASAIPRHMHTDSNVNANTPNSYSAATANNILTDDASILTLASSSKRRRRSMDTDASVRAMAPNSVFGGSRESLPLSVLSTGMETGRYSVQGFGGPSAERASVYSSSGLAREGIGSPALASERNSYYYRQAGDAKSLRSITNVNKTDNASITGIYPRSEYDARSINNAGDVASLKSVEAKTMDGHVRNGSITNSIGSPVTSPSLLRQASTGGNTLLSLRRRSSDLHEREDINAGEEERGEP